MKDKKKKKHKKNKRRQEFIPYPVTPVISATNNQQPETSNPQQATENMEVHKHPHHPTHKKKWGEYFLEFLMIFLAVTLGFFAENFRENISDSHLEKRFAQQLYSE